jgi:lysozyme
MDISASGIALIKQFEGCRLSAYRDVSGVLTVGWGHTGKDVTKGLTITQARADTLLRQDLNEFVIGVNQCV